MPSALSAPRPTPSLFFRFCPWGLKKKQEKLGGANLGASGVRYTHTHDGAPSAAACVQCARSSTSRRGTTRSRLPLRPLTSCSTFSSAWDSAGSRCNPPAPARPTPALLSSALLPPLRPAQHRHLWWALERLSFFNRSFRPHHPRSLQVPALSVEAAQLQLEQPEGLQITALTGAVGTVGSSIVVPAFLALQASAAPHFRSVAATSAATVAHMAHHHDTATAHLLTNVAADHFTIADVAAPLMTPPPPLVHVHQSCAATEIDLWVRIALAAHLLATLLGASLSHATVGGASVVLYLIAFLGSLAANLQRLAAMPWVMQHGSHASVSWLLAGGLAALRDRRVVARVELRPSPQAETSRRWCVRCSACGSSLVVRLASALGATSAFSPSSSLPQPPRTSSCAGAGRLRQPWT